MQKKMIETNINTSSENRDGVFDKLCDGTYCGDDHLNNENLVKGLVEYNGT